MVKITPEEHQAQHIRLHRAFDELLACYLSENRGRVMRTSIHDEIFALMQWSHRKTLAPTPVTEDSTGDAAMTNQERDGQVNR